MLRQLIIRDFVIVDRLTLDFDAGFAVLTGETGAGKSLLVDALSLLMGERGESGLVRAGADRADLNAIFDLTHIPALKSWLQDLDLTGDDSAQLLVRRTIDTEGKSRAYLNGFPATILQLREAGEHLVDIHGQHAHQSLLRGEAQRQLLDAFAGAAPLAHTVQQAHKQWQTATTQLKQAESAAQTREMRLGELQSLIDDLEPLTLPTEMWQALQARHHCLANTATLQAGAATAVDLLQEGDQAVLGPLHQLQLRLVELALLDPALQDAVQMLDQANIQLREAAYTLRHYRDRADLNTAEFETADQKLAAIFQMARKYRVHADDLHALLQSAKTEQHTLAASGDLAALRQTASDAAHHFAAQCTELTTVRHHAANRLSEAVNATLTELALAGTTFSIGLPPLEQANSQGAEHIEYRIAHHGGTARPLVKVASGGELSRISLAIQVAMSDVAKVPTLLFDEVDVGIGGRVADTVGRLLRNLGERYQVFSITHLPQVAAHGHHHWQVSKTLQDDGVVSQLTYLSEAERVEEIARMLGGETLTDTTREHARELLAH